MTPCSFLPRLFQQIENPNEAATTDFTIDTWLQALGSERIQLQEIEIFPDKYMVGFAPEAKESKIKSKIDKKNLEHAFWDSSREWKVEQVSLQRQYLHPHGALGRVEK